MRCLRTAAIAVISVSLFGVNAEAASYCTTPDELAALRTAAVQQELMVAGFTCQAADAYNRFVLAYRPELQKSDADLKAYFVRRDGARGEAEYDTFKTKLANLSSLSDIANASGFCAGTQAAFVAAGHQSLASFIADQRLMIALPEQQLCHAEPVLARVEPVAVGGVPPHSLPASPYGASPYAAAPGVAQTSPLPPAWGPRAYPPGYGPYPYSYYGR